MRRFASLRNCRGAIEPRSRANTVRWSVVVLAAVVSVGLLPFGVPQASAVGPCDPPVLNPVACENTKPGTPSAEWGILGAGDSSIQGFATESSVQPGATVQFKIATNAAAYRIDILRAGYYQGHGARKVASNVLPSAALPQNQPGCIADPTTGLHDCGNWAVSASWTVPSDAVSGMYFAHVVRNDTGGSSHIFFVVRNDSGDADIIYQTSETTRQAYNRYGGSSLYYCEADCPANLGPPRALKVSFNRPDTSAALGIEYSFFGAESQAIFWLEQNGYDVAYQSGVDTDRLGAANLEQHKIFLSSGHDEYWTTAQRANVEAARDAGVNLVFWSGNEMFWKMRYENSIDGTATPYRTEVTYKETFGGTPDPLAPTTRTGTWRDTRFGAPGDGGRPENSLTGTMYMVDPPNSFPIKVPADDGKMRLWRNTSVATLAPGETATLAPDTLGYEWDSDVDNGFRPAGLSHLSSNTEAVSSVADQNFGTTIRPGVATHHMTLYRAPSGALVFGAGTIQYSWGLAGDPNGINPPDSRMQQAMVNLFADMGVQPATLQAGLVPATPSTDTTPPTATITSPTAGAVVANGSDVTVSGTASDVGGQVAGVEVSTDDGATWHPAVGRGSWTYTWRVQSAGPVTVRARATDDSANIEGGGSSVAVTADCPCQLFPNSSTPFTSQTPDFQPIELGVRFTTSADGYITGVRFYKDAENTGTHVGSLWAINGDLLGQATFTAESASGWQQVSFASAVPVNAGETYIASYNTSVGRYSSSSWAFTNATVDSGPLHAPADTPSAPNGLFTYSATPTMPSNGFQGANYWVDATFATTAVDTTAPFVVAQAPGAGTTVSTLVTPTATFNENVVPATVNFTLTGPGSTPVPGTVSYANRVATFTPSSALSPGTTYAASVSGAQDLSGNQMTAPVSWSFTAAVPAVCPCSLWSTTSATPTTVDAGDDGANVELGVKFSADTSGFVTGVSFYKAAANTGTHTGSLWNAAGELLATATFTNESTSGWQHVEFSNPVAVTAGATYVASYHTTTGHYSVNPGYFDAAYDHPPLHAPTSGSSGGNGVFRYGDSAFPSDSFGSASYWVDVEFISGAGDTTPPAVTLTVPASGAALNSSTPALSGAAGNASGDSNTVVVKIYAGSGTAGPELQTINVTRSGGAWSTNTAALATGQYTAQATQTDLAGNPGVSSANTFTVDVSPPAITSVASTQDVNTATITWTTDELSSSRVDYGTTPGALNQNSTNATPVTAHSIGLSGLGAHTTYYYRVTSVDALGNSATSPDPGGPPASLTTDFATLTDSTVANFSAGTSQPITTYVAQGGNGEVMLLPALGAEFTGTSVPSTWASSVLAAGGGVSVTGGSLRVDGAWARTTATFAGPRSVEFEATFTSTANQSVGFGNSLNETPWAMFSTRTGGALRVSTRNGLTPTELSLGATYLGAPHTYRIAWNTSSVVYSVDGAIVATHNIAIPGTMRAVVRDNTAGGSAVLVNWLRITPYVSPGTFTSRVFGGSVSVLWDSASWTTGLPPGTSIVVRVRTGNSPNPNGSWTAFTTLPASGAPINVRSRYIQYQLTLTTSNNAQSPNLQDLTLRYGA